MSTPLPAVDPGVTAEIVAALSPRLRKRLDGAVAKLTALPMVRERDSVRIALDDETVVELHAPGGTVTTADAVRCGCLLAPACVHRAAAVSAAPVADPPSTGTGTGPGPGPGTTTGAAEPVPDTPAAPTDEQTTACAALFTAAAAALDTGRDGAGAVHQADLLRAAHTARLAGLHRPAAAAVSVVTQLRAARAAAPEHRLPELADRLREVLHAAHRIPAATGPELVALRGTARRAYTPEGSLRLHGLFTEPVLTPGGYAGAVTWTADATGRRYTVNDTTPGGATRAAAAGERTVRMGDTALTHRELSRSGLAVSGGTLSASGRLGAGAGVRAVRAVGTPWNAAPLTALWEEPPADQAARALAARDNPTPGRDDLLFLTVTLLGTVREAAGDCLLAHSEGLTVRLTLAHDHPALPYRDNLRLLASRPGLRLRAIARLLPAAHPRAQLLAVSHPTQDDAHVNLGLERLRTADLPPATSPAPAPSVTPAPHLAGAPLHLLRRRLHQAAAGGRALLT
uniref:hypothetical protein n=1 Tax=Streptomyces otsuchiensis TaxID=2681388 RepID=UPI0010317DE8